MIFKEFFCFHRKFLLLNLVGRNLKIKYRHSLLGYFWTLLVPIFQVCLFYLVYQVILKVPIPNYLLFVMSGLMPWIFFSSTVIESMESVVSAQHLLLHASVPVQALPMAITLTNFTHFLLSFPLVFILMAAHQVPFYLQMVWVIPLILLLLLFVTSFSFLLSCGYVYFRDLRHIMNIVMQLWLYCTPILYHWDLVPVALRGMFIWLNPLSGFFITFRQVLLEGQAPSIHMLAAFLTWTAAILFAGMFMFRRFGARVVESL